MTGANEATTINTKEISGAGATGVDMGFSVKVIE